jgi:hypothetical protein
MLKKIAVLLLVTLLATCTASQQSLEQSISSINKQSGTELVKTIEFCPDNPVSVREMNTMLDNPKWQLLECKDLKNGKYRATFLKKVE